MKKKLKYFNTINKTAEVLKSMENSTAAISMWNDT